MKLNAIIPLLLLLIILSSCKKEGCTVSYAINYDEDAKTDDESCLYYTQVRITHVSCSGWPSTNIFGNPWDSGDAPDTYIAIYLQDNNGQSISYESNVTNNNSSGFEEFTVDMAPIDSLNQSIRFAIEDEDGFFDSEMDGENINFWDFTHQGTAEHKYSTTFVRGNFTIQVEWL